MENGERTIRLDLTCQGIKRITMLPLDNDGMSILKGHGMDAEEAFGDLFDKVWREDAGQLSGAACQRSDLRLPLRYG